MMNLEDIQGKGPQEIWIQVLEKFGYVNLGYIHDMVSVDHIDTSTLDTQLTNKDVRMICR
jgi:hypothetical protein